MEKVDKKFISKRIATLRNAKGISARAMSLDLGQSSEYINQIENGRSIPSIEGLINICDYFGITLSEFFDTNLLYPIQYKELIKELNKLDSLELQKIIDIIKLITQRHN